MLRSHGIENLIVTERIKYGRKKTGAGRQRPKYLDGKMSISCRAEQRNGDGECLDRSAAQVNRLDLQVSGHSQWLCHDNSTVNIALHYSCYFFSLSTLVAVWLSW